MCVRERESERETECVCACERERERVRERENRTKYGQSTVRYPEVTGLRHSYLQVCVCVCVCDKIGLSMASPLFFIWK